MGTATRIFKELPCFGVTFSNIHPASKFGFLSGIFSGGGGKIYSYANFFCYANFSIVLNQIWGGGQTASGESQESAEQCIKTQKGVVVSTCSPSLQRKGHSPIYILVLGSKTILFMSYKWIFQGWNKCHINKGSQSTHWTHFYPCDCFLVSKGNRAQ